MGSGFIITGDGQIVTNAHVVDGADTVKVTLADGRKIDGKVLGADAATDIALIKIEEGSDLPTVAFGDSTQLKVGQDVVAIGNPFGPGSSVTAGIVSALGFDKAEGVLITDVTTDTPAAKAGLERGDIVLNVDGAQVKDPRDLTRMIATNVPGSEVKLGLLRDGKPVDATVTLGTRPDQPA
ncbi:MAG: trypsin-like peptidase domain-containing protein [Albidovulum sp.]|uniref:S1C family serine protease n=1 Tax=Albidovulum sp. TaxID=1872424 RepID=UPI003CB0C546